MRDGVEFKTYPHFWRKDAFTPTPLKQFLRGLFSIGSVFCSYKRNRYVEKLRCSDPTVFCFLIRYVLHLSVMGDDIHKAHQLNKLYVHQSKILQDWCSTSKVQSNLEDKKRIELSGDSNCFIWYSKLSLFVRVACLIWRGLAQQYFRVCWAYDVCWD